MLWIVAVVVYVVGLFLAGAGLQIELELWPRRTALLIVFWPLIATLGVLFLLACLLRRQKRYRYQGF